MSLRYVGKMVYQAAATSLRSAALQGSKSAKAAGSSGLTSGRQTQAQPASRCFSNKAKAGLAASASEKVRLKEDSLRTVMFLSYWGPF